MEAAGTFFVHAETLLWLWLDLVILVGRLLTLNGGSSLWPDVRTSCAGRPGELAGKLPVSEDGSASARHCEERTCQSCS